MAASLSHSQNGQDLYIAETVFARKRGGFFVEAGAGDGFWISNTLLLERDYGWTGILIEPTSAFALLKRNRPHCICDDSCLAGTARTVTLVEIFDRGQAGISADASENLLRSQTVDGVPPTLSQMNSRWGEARTQYQKQALPLADVLRKHQAPKSIDYFSLDVEGNELDILQHFPFEEYVFGCLGIERPPDALRGLLAANGYFETARLGEDIFFRPG